MASLLRNHHTCAITSYLLSLFFLSLLTLSKSLPEQTEASVSNLCDVSLLKSYINIEQNETQNRVSAKMVAKCPHLARGDPFCCNDSHMDDLWIQYKASTTTFVHTKDNLEKLIATLSQSHKENRFSSESLQKSTKNKCKHEIDFDLINTSLDSIALVNLSIFEFLEFQFDMTSSFMCEVCTPHFSRLLDQDSKEITLSMGSFAEFLSIMHTSGKAFVMFTRQIELLFSSVFCMEKGEFPGEELLLSSDLRRLQSEEFAALVSKCEEQMQKGDVDKDCFVELGSFIRVNNKSILTEYYSLILNVLVFIVRVFEQGRDVASPMEINFDVVNQAKVKVPSTKTKEERPELKQKLVIDSPPKSDPSEDLSGTTYGKEIKEMGSMQTKGTLLSKDSYDQKDQDTQKEQNKLMELRFPNSLRMFPIIDSQSVQFELESFSVVFDKKDGLDFIINAPMHDWKRNVNQVEYCVRLATWFVLIGFCFFLYK